ncbi:hypothetical protein JOC36_000845 [Weissella uvarum]|nr:hypothetical protein [Weissella uvarum]
MKLTIEGTEEEIKNTLQAIGSSDERKEDISISSIDNSENIVVPKPVSEHLRHQEAQAWSAILGPHNNPC